MAKKSKPMHRTFESKTEHGKFTKVCADMMQSSAWESLLLRQQGLYLRLKSKYTQKVSNGFIVSENADNISLPKSEAEKIYGDLRTFRKDIRALMECGLIKIVQHGQNTRTANIYGFSDAWKHYQTSSQRHATK